MSRKYKDRLTRNGGPKDYRMLYEGTGLQFSFLGQCVRCQSQGDRCWWEPALMDEAGCQ